MADIEVSPTREQVVRDLRSAMTGRGLAARGAQRRDSLRTLPLTADAADDAEAHQLLLGRLRALTARLYGVAGRGGPTLTDLANAALGLGHWQHFNGGLHDRLRALSGRQGPAVNTLLGYLRELTPQIADELLRETATMVTKGPTGSGDHPYLVARTRVLHRIRNRRAHHTIVTRTVIPQSAALTRFTVQAYYPNDQTEEAFEVRALANCRPVIHRSRSTGEKAVELDLPETPPGQPVTFSYEFIVRSPEPDRPYLRHLARVPGGPLLMRVQFEDDHDRPDAVWSFDGEDVLYDPADALHVGSRQPLNPFGYTEVLFADQSPLQHYGVAWQWPTNCQSATT